MYGSTAVPMTCEVCGRKIHTASIVGGITLCAICYHNTFGAKEIVNHNITWVRPLPADAGILKYLEDE